MSTLNIRPSFSRQTTPF